ncbi:MAG: ribosome recycling factor [Chloroflexia bacterium]
MIDDVMKDAEIHMQKAIEALHRELATIRTGRATPALVERVMVEYYGVPTPLNQVAGITAPEARLLQISPWEKNMLGPIEKAIQKSELGLNPTNDGKIIRIAVPALTEQRRKEFVKLVKGHVEDCRVSIRNIRRHAMNDLKALEDEKEIAEDEHKRANEKLQALVDRYIRDAEHVGDEKEAGVMEV